MPLDRAAHCRFIPIAPKVNCYGCQSNTPPPITGVICSRGNPFDPPCTHQFSLQEIEAAIQSILNEKTISSDSNSLLPSTLSEKLSTIKVSSETNFFAQ
jgi:hypothetical protein